MNKQEFTEKVFEPYNDAFKIISIIQHGNETDEQTECFERYMDAVAKFGKKYKGNLFADKLREFLHEADNAIAKMNKGGSNAVQKAKKEE